MIEDAIEITPTEQIDQFTISISGLHLDARLVASIDSKARHERITGVLLGLPDGVLKIICEGNQRNLENFIHGVYTLAHQGRLANFSVTRSISKQKEVRLSRGLEEAVGIPFGGGSSGRPPFPSPLSLVRGYVLAIRMPYRVLIQSFVGTLAIWLIFSLSGDLENSRMIGVIGYFFLAGGILLRIRSAIKEIRMPLHAEEQSKAPT